MEGLLSSGPTMSSFWCDSYAKTLNATLVRCTDNLHKLFERLSISSENGDISLHQIWKNVRLVETRQGRPR